MDSVLPVHWRYAAANAFVALKKHLCDFDFERETGPHAYAGISPAYFLQIIDGFLAESDEVVLGSNRRELQELREMIISRFQPSFTAGFQDGKTEWDASGRVYGTLSPEEYREIARKAAPGNLPERNWYIEGFCQSWAGEEFNSLGGTKAPPLG